MKAPKTTSPELTAEDLLKNIKENIHLIKYREIPWKKYYELSLLFVKFVAWVKK